MASAKYLLKCLLFFICVSLHLMVTSVGAGGLGLGINWGTQSSHRLSPSIVVNVLQANNISKVKLFDADPRVLQALTGTHINVMLGIPNEMLKTLSKSRAAAKSWVHDNVTRYAFKGGVDIRYIAVGNEPFLASYRGQFRALVLPAVLNIQQALEKANLANQVKVVVPCNADAYQSKVPSKGIFRPDLNKTMHQLVSFLSTNGSPFVVNIYPFLDVLQSKNSSSLHPFFENSTRPLMDGRKVYNNDFERILDSLETALKQIGFAQMPIIIGGIGWPTEGATNATISNAKRFNKGLINYIKRNKGTPLRPGNPPVETYIYSLLDEDQKSIAAGDFERHWGVFTFDGQVKYEVDLGQGSSKDLASAENVEYFSSKWCVVNDNLDLTNVSSHVQLACSTADCTVLSSGGSCNKIGAPANISYAFNSYYQLHNQSGDSCYFDGLGMITTADPSIGDCRFLVGISDSSVCAVYNRITTLIVQCIVLLCTLTFLSNTF